MNMFDDDFDRRFDRQFENTRKSMVKFWLVGILVNILFWGSLIALGFYAVNKFS
jgi:hypothetical protein